MFFFPVNTDAPIYYRPVGTLLLIAANIAVFFGVQNPESLILSYGDGLHPVQWVTSNFCHEGFFHLLTNMMFLWGFGLVVEGKLGWLRFLAVYLGIGVLQCSIEQFLMLGAEKGGSLGASSILFALMTISVVWAPKNEMTCFLFAFLLYRIIATTFELSILTFGMLFVGINILSMLMFGFQVSSELLHLSGALIGFGVGFLFLKLKWVDCENWDLVSVMQNKHIAKSAVQETSPLLEAKYQLDPVSKKWKEKDGDEDRGEKEAKQERKRGKFLSRIRKNLKDGKPNAALSEYHNAKRQVDDFKISATDLEQLGNDLYRRKLYDNAAAIYEEYVSLFPELANTVRIHLAAIQVEKQQRPQAALETISPVDVKKLPARFEKTHRQIVQKANHLIDEGVLEI